LPEDKQEESFRVIDRRPFTAEGDIRKDVVEAEERKAEREAQLEAARQPAARQRPAVSRGCTASFSRV
jgi:hypothetical protein